MTDYFLIAAGVLGLITSAGHGYIGHVRLVSPLDGIDARAKRALGTVFQLTTIYWVMGGIALILAPFTLSATPREVLAIFMAVIYGTAALGNLWITRGFHFGWVMLTAATVLAIAGR
ncbi:MAG: hypothetical protein QNJ40_20855 [Xanthomonadales bacterium]|nr:hypothetical protein [Xanthomonadales bacterium]